MFRGPKQVGGFSAFYNVVLPVDFECQLEKFVSDRILEKNRSQKYQKLGLWAKFSTVTVIWSYCILSSVY